MAGAVRISGSPSVIRSCILIVRRHLPSAVRTVQPSGIWRMAAVPAFTMGSTARVMPRRSRDPGRDDRSWESRVTRASGCRCRGRHTHGRWSSRDSPHRSGSLRKYHTAGSLPCKLDPLEEALPGHVDQILSFRRNLAAGEGRGAVPVESSDIGAYIDADDVTLLQHPWTRDTVDDFVIDADTDAGRIALIMEEGGGTAPCLRMKCSTALSISWVVTPGFTNSPA